MGLVAVLVLLASPLLPAQTVTGTAGPPGATTSIDVKQLPAPDPKFGGDIKIENAEYFTKSYLCMTLSPTKIVLIGFVGE